MGIEWRQSLSVGDQVIDDDHKHLIELVNAYEAAVAGHDLDLLTEVFEDLYRYTEEHFEREENVQRAIHFPERHSHHDKHQDLKNQVRRIHYDLMERKRGAIDLEELNQLMHDWLVEHIIHEDLKMAPYLKGGRG